MATKTNGKKPHYDLKAADRRRALLIRVGLTGLVVVIAVALVLYIVLTGHKKPAAGEAKSIQVTSAGLITKPGTKEAKATVSMYEDFLCPHCGAFEQEFGPTIGKLIDSGAIAADYTMLGILDSPRNDDYSTRAAAAGYCVADESIDAFRRFHAALYAQQPDETATSTPTNAQLIETARQAGAGGSVPDCVNSGRYVDMIKGLAAASGVQATPTVRINGQDYQYTTPDALVAKITEITGPVPGVAAQPPAPTPTPTQTPVAAGAPVKPR